MRWVTSVPTEKLHPQAPSQAEKEKQQRNGNHLMVDGLCLLVPGKKLWEPDSVRQRFPRHWGTGEHSKLFKIAAIYQV